jgi:ATP-dependent exoDNAse (exonuclease V) alpha subunit
MPVKTRINNIKYGIVNNQTFVIKEIRQKDETIVLKDDDEQIQIPFDQFQHLFYVAYCITIYKSQGVSINEHYVVH